MHVLGKWQRIVVRKQVGLRKVLLDPEAPACLLTLLCHYGNPLPRAYSLEPPIVQGLLWYAPVIHSYVQASEVICILCLSRKCLLGNAYTMILCNLERATSILLIYLSVTLCYVTVKQVCTLQQIQR